MPQRFLRPGLTTSEAWNSVSWAAQSLYIRILTLVDDFGRYDARVRVLHGECFALRDDVTPQDTAAFRSELQQVGLITIYEVGGKEYLQITKWKEHARSRRSIYPSHEAAPQGPAPSQANGASPLKINAENRVCSEVEAFTYGRTLMPPCPQDRVSEWWLGRDRVGWVDRHGTPIRKWQSDLAAWWLSVQHRQLEQEAMRNHQPITAARLKKPSADLDKPFRDFIVSCYPDKSEEWKVYRFAPDYVKSEFMKSRFWPKKP